MLLGLPQRNLAQILEEGVLQESRFLISLPEQWNGKLLMIAHGYIGENQPLSADFSPEKAIYQDLVESGWMVASTSYRRNGMIIKDAIKDLDLLHGHISKIYGRPKTTLLMGSSMGGLIGTLIAESPGRRYHGVLCIGAALQISDEQEPFKLNYRPKIPILFIANRTEYEAPRSYTNLARAKNIGLWKINRDGHVNVNQQEQIQALRALEGLVQGYPITLTKDGTVNLNPQSTAEYRKEGAFSRIGWVDPVYGNLYTELIPTDLQRLKVNKGQKFTISYKGHSYPVLYGSDYGDVQIGEWVAFVSGEGTFQISCNYCNASKMLEYQKGDRIFIQR